MCVNKQGDILMVYIYTVNIYMKKYIWSIFSSYLLFWSKMILLILEYHFEFLLIYWKHKTDLNKTPG